MNFAGPFEDCSDLHLFSFEQLDVTISLAAYIISLKQCVYILERKYQELLHIS